MEPIRFLFTRGRQDFVATIDVIYDLCLGLWRGCVSLVAVTNGVEYDNTRDSISSFFIISDDRDVNREVAFDLAVTSFCEYLEDFGLYKEKEKFVTLHKKIVG